MGQLIFKKNGISNAIPSEKLVFWGYSDDAKPQTHVFTVIVSNQMIF
jgi:hypothetical protein